jgi:hypothetical protein
VVRVPYTKLKKISCLERNWGGKLIADLAELADVAVDTVHLGHVGLEVALLGGLVVTHVARVLLALQ